MIRVFVALLSFVSLLFLPFWVACILGILLAFFWEAPEVIFLGVVTDLLYMPPGGVFYIPMPMTLAAIALVWLMVPIRKRLLVVNE